MVPRGSCARVGALALALALSVITPRVNGNGGGGLCPASCSTIDRSPVCGHNPQGGYQTFSSICSLLCSAGDWNLAHVGDCKPRELDDHCRPDYLPVCGYSPTKGYKSFTNMCYLYLENGCSYGDYTLAHQGMCTNNEVPPAVCQVKCERLYQPVCGYSASRGYRTFPSECSLGLENSCHHADYVQCHSGECSKEEIEKNCKRTCPQVVIPVCGKSPTRGYKTFTNVCLFFLDNSCPTLGGEGATDAGYQRSGESLKRRAQLFRWLRGCMEGATDAGYQRSGESLKRRGSCSGGSVDVWVKSFR
ncbi:hypothetical protein J6590_027774 [Homalodisca vitripennis]|nr:hypothetical protein J6590_027774 [Homalodisca vitripennis]